ncbi:MAG: MFS transporter [Chlamydiae bacterium]|nr:MFS transporter [Chlamydiota bacterium]
MIRSPSMKFVILIGFVSLFADVTYEGARSITGPFLATFGASAATVGFIAGFGELIGYGLRLVSGYVSDKTGRYWTIIFIGYAINLFAVPLLALAGNWKMAGILIIAERTGKAIRSPARDAMLSHATSEIGHGWGFGFHEAMDQIGAMLGPLIVSSVLYFKGSYKTGFLVLLIPALLALSVLSLARFLYPHPKDLEKVTPHFESKSLSKIYWIYLSAVVLIAAGYADFPLIAYHFEKVESIPKIWIPVSYSIAMGIDTLSALFFGRWFDRKGLSILIVASVIASFFAPLVFLGGFYQAILGMGLWGLGMGAQESVMRAAIAQMVSTDRRGTAYGIFNAGYGLFWFLGSVILGKLYDVSILSMIFFSILTQLLSVPLLFLVRGNKRQV